MGIAGDLVDCMRFHVFFFCEFQEMYWVFMGSCWDFMKILWDLLGITSMKHDKTIVVIYTLWAQRLPEPIFGAG